jgi:hypothetical protein
VFLSGVPALCDVRAPVSVLKLERFEARRVRVIWVSRGAVEWVVREIADHVASYW